MKIQVKDFKLKDSLLSGQCFRVTEEIDDSFTVILFDRVINIKQDSDGIEVHSNIETDLERIIRDYFEFDRDYNTIYNKLKVDMVMKDCIDRCKGYKILKQNKFEMCISYIISQNNSVKRISNSINKLCTLRGKEVVFNNKKYYLFPTYEELENITCDELRSLGIGFRDKYILDFLVKYNNLIDLNKLSTSDALTELMKVKGIGLKVASCILLFGYSRFNVYPIDTWVKQFISNKYHIKNDQKTIELFTREKFAELSGIALQYMYHSERNKIEM